MLHVYPFYDGQTVCIPNLFKLTNDAAHFIDYGMNKVVLWICSSSVQLLTARDTWTNLHITNEGNIGLH